MSDNGGDIHDENRQLTAEAKKELLTEIKKRAASASNSETVLKLAHAYVLVVGASPGRLPGGSPAAE